MRRICSALACMFMLVLVVSPVAAQGGDGAQALRAAVNWVQGQQQPDGSFPGFGPGETADAIAGLVAAGVDPNGLIKNGSSPVSYLGNQIQLYAEKSVGANAKVIMAAVAAGKDPRSFGGRDLVVGLGRGYNPANGQYGADVTGHCLALLAARSVGATPPQAAFDRLAALQNADGGWSFDGQVASGSDTNTVGLCVQAIAPRGDSPVLAKALGYLATQQNADGGFPYSKSSSFGSDSDANSTALVIQAYAAAGRDTAPLVQALLRLQNPSGAFRYQAAAPEDNALATYQALAAVLAKPLPVVTANVPFAQDVIAAGADATPPVPVALPTTGAQPELALWPLLMIALLLLAGGMALTRVRR